ncbi:MAG TPA: class I SAM-dependent methyltransferase [Gaiellaceae bacterium]|nr:class I SAM-dependent methyltransferase [Gaiellaceae bacterium]
MDAAERLRQVRERLVLDELTPVAIGPDEGAALRELVCSEGARRTIETGLGYAVSTLFICEGLLANGAEGRHVAIDPRLPNSHVDAGLRLLEEAGVRDLVELHAERSEVVLPRLLAAGRRFDLAFVDGNHRFEGVFLDLVYCGRLLSAGAVVFADDMQLPAVRRATGFCIANLGWTVEDEGREGEHEWVVLRTGPPEAYDRPFDSFVDF